MTAIVAGIVSAVFLSALTVVRIAGKRAVRSWGLDDAFVTISFVLALVTIGLSIYSTFKHQGLFLVAWTDYIDVRSVILWLGQAHVGSARRAGHSRA